MKLALRLAEGTLLHLSNDHYYLNIIQDQKYNYRIISDSKIVFYDAISLKQIS
jgi:hypothetical protein